MANNLKDMTTSTSSPQMVELSNLFISLPIWSHWLIGVLLTSLSGLIIYAAKNYFTAAKEFRNTIYTALEGIYPETAETFSSSRIDIKIQASINAINSAGAKFRHHLPFFCIGFFNRALDNYCKTARDTNWRKYFQYVVSTGIDKPTKENPKEQLKKAVDKLIKYAK